MSFESRRASFRVSRSRGAITSLREVSRLSWPLVLLGDHATTLPFEAEVQKKCECELEGRLWRDEPMYLCGIGC